MTIDSPCSDEEFEKLVAAAKGCPVRVSLAEQVEVDESYERAGANAS